ncbi:hypothetical protein [Micromonospora viridifaciens]|nr:hypothetical protein [Micromonospora viridifaciens]
MLAQFDDDWGAGDQIHATRPIPDTNLTSARAASTPHVMATRR